MVTNIEHAESPANTFVSWYLYTSRLVGAPLLAIGLLYAVQYTVFTFTCAAASYQCKKAIGFEELFSQYAARMVAAGKGELKVKEE